MTDDLAPQDTAEWLEARVGSLGASKVGDALSRLKRTGERTKVALDLMYELAAERLTGVPARSVNPRQWGIDHEAEARAAYAFLTNEPVVQVGLIPHPTIPHAHASPDSLVGADGALEIKCPTSATHLKTLLADAVPEEHLPQCHWAMACSGRAFCDFVSWDPRFKEDRLQFFQKRVMRDAEAIATMEYEARVFLVDIEAKLAALAERVNAA